MKSEMRRVKYGREGRQGERCHKHEQMAERRVRERERQAERARKRESEEEGEKERRREKESERNLDQAEKGLKFTLGNAVSRTGKLKFQKIRPKNNPKENKPLKPWSYARWSVKTEPPRPL